jgi:hypothetical protein
MPHPHLSRCLHLKLTHYTPQVTFSEPGPMLSCKTVRLVRPERFELPTLGSEDRCSIQLSYGRTGCVFRNSISPSDVFFGA